MSTCRTYLMILALLMTTILSGCGTMHGMVNDLHRLMDSASQTVDGMSRGVEQSQGTFDELVDTLAGAEEPSPENPYR